MKNGLIDSRFLFAPSGFAPGMAAPPLMGSVMRLRSREGAPQAIEAIREHSVHEILTADKIVHACAEGFQGIIDTSCKIIELRQINRATLELAHALAHVKPGECETDICGH